MWKLPLFKIHTDADDIRAVADVISRGTHWADGPEIGEFEKEASSYIGRKHGIAFNNGTSALHALMLAYGIGPGDEVIVPSFTFISTANAPLFTGAKPSLVDIETETYGLDPQKVEQNISEKTKAIMPIHYAGHSCLIKELKEIAEKHDLILIEDAAESMGSTYENKMTGSFGDASMFSFCQNKIISTGEGGAILTDDSEIDKKLRLLRSQGRASVDYFTGSGSTDYVSLGYNFRMPTMCAALGISQLKKIEKLIEMRRHVAHKYNNAFTGVQGISPPKEQSGCRHVYQLYTVLLDDNHAREGLRKHLGENGIMSKIYFDPIHLSRHFSSIGDITYALPVTEDIGSRVLSLPIYPGMPDAETDHVISKIKEFIGE